MASGHRVAIFTDTFSPQINGVSRTLERLVNAIESRGGDVRVETVEVPGSAEDSRVRRWPSIPFWAYPQLRMAAPATARVIEQLREWRPTLVHATTPFGVGLAGRAAAIELDVPLVTSYHTSFAAYLKHYHLTALDAIAWPYLRWFHNSGELTLAPSQMVARELAGQDFTNVRVWSRGVDLHRFNPSCRSDELRREAGAGPDDFVVAYVGRLAPEKGIHVAIDAMHQVMARRGMKVRFMIAGDGPDEEKCRVRAPDGTWFAGMLSGERLSTFYASADALLFPSTTETFGNVVLEALASGVPVIAPDTGATLELADDKTALTFRAGDSSSLAAQVERLILDRTLGVDRRRAGLEVAAARSWDSVWERLIADYSDASGVSAEVRAA